MLNSHVFQLQGRVTSVIKSGTTNTTVRWLFKEKPGNRLSQVEITEEGKGLDYAVYGSNPDYVFILKRKSPDSPWVLRDFKKKPTDQDFRLPEEYRSAGALGSGLQGILTTVSVSRLADLVREPNFRVAHAAVVKQNGAELVRIEFENPHSMKQVPFEPIQSGAILLDPQQSWCLRGYEVHSQHSNSLSTLRSDIVEIRDSSTRGFPLPVHIADTTTSQATEPEYLGQTYVSSSDMQYDVDETRPPADSDFRLPAFGLPEMQEPATRPWWSLWAVVASFVCIAAAGVWWWFLRRKAPKPAA